MEPAKVTVTFQDVVDDRDLAVRFRMPAVPRVDETFMIGRKIYTITRVVWKVPADLRRINEMDVYVRCLFLLEQM